MKPAADPIEVLRELAGRAQRGIEALQDGSATSGRYHLTTIYQRASDVVRHHQEDGIVPQLDSTQKTILLGHADQLADQLATEYGRSRIGAPTYSAADRDRGFWSVVVTGMTDDIERRKARVFMSGDIEGDVALEDGGTVSPLRLQSELDKLLAQPPVGYDIEAGANPDRVPGDPQTWLVWRHAPGRNGPRRYVCTRLSRDEAIAAAVADDERRDREQVAS